MRENSGPRAHGPLQEPAPQQPPQTLTSVYCLSAFGVRSREGRGPALPAPAGTAPLGRGQAATSRPLGSAERGCVDARSPRRPGGACVLVAHRPLAFLSESFGAGTSPRCAGRRAAEAAGRGPGSVGRSWASGREPKRRPGPDAAPPAAASLHRRRRRRRCATWAAPRAGRGQLFPPTQLRAWVSLAPPPLLSMPSLFIPLLPAPPPGKILLLHGSKSGPF